MKAITYLYFLFTLTACAVLAQETGVERLPATTPAKLVAQPTTAAGLETSVLLAEWKEPQQQYQIRPVDPATGQTPPGYTPVSLEGTSLYILVYALSRDGQKVAVTTGSGQSCEPYAGGTSCRPSAELLHLIDRPTWREVQVTLPGHGWAGPFAFSPDSTRLALVYNQIGATTLMLFDTTTGEVMARQILDVAPTLLSYVQAGTTLVVYGVPEGAEPGVSKPASPVLRLLDAASLTVEWERTLTNLVSGYWCLENCAASHEARSSVFWQPAVVLSPDGRKLYFVHADEERLTTVDLDSRTIQSTAVQVAQTWFDRLLALTAGVAQAKGNITGASKEAVLSSDGHYLYVLSQPMITHNDSSGQEQVAAVPPGLQVINIESGDKVANYDSQATRLRLTPDGKHLLLAGWGTSEPWTEVVDIQSLQPVTHLEGWEVIQTRQLDGQPVLLAHQPGQLAVLDSHSFELNRIQPVARNVSWLAEE